MNTQTCFKCQKEKPLDEFYKHPQMANGHLGKCKECNKIDVRANYAKRREYYAQYERRRSQKLERKEMALAYQRNRRKKFPGKNRARGKVNNALRNGRIQKLPCAVCGDGNSEAHHIDYRKPLVVQWLCREHHLEAEGKVAYSTLTL